MEGDVDRQRVTDVLSLTCTFDASSLILPLSKTSDLARCTELDAQEKPLFYAHCMDNVSLPYRTGLSCSTASPDMHTFCHLYSASENSQRTAVWHAVFVDM